jgi:hypothetical protein
VDDLNAAIRENPIAAALIGGGALWMLLGNKGFAATATGLAAAATGTGAVAGKAGAAAYSAARSAAHAVGGAGASVASNIKSAGAHVTDKVASIVPDLSADTTSDYGFTPEQSSERTARSQNSLAASTGRYANNLKSTLADTFERQPLLLGALGLAIGASIASSFRTTAIESEWIGEQGAAAREKLKQAASEAGERAWQAGKDEAQKQNLTEDAGWDAAERIAEKAQGVFKAGRDALGTAAGGASRDWKPVK